jgi:hypothetical protein
MEPAGEKFILMAIADETGIVFNGIHGEGFRVSLAAE